MSSSETPFEYIIRVGYADTDRMSFAHHSRYLVYMESARTELLRSTGYSYREMEERDHLLPLTEVHVQFVKPALYDDVLHVKTSISHLTRTRMQFDYEIYCPAREVVIVRSYTKHAFMNKEGRPVRADPDEFAKLQKLVGSGGE